MSFHHKVRVKTSHEPEFVGKGAGLLSFELGSIELGSIELCHQKYSPSQIMRASHLESHVNF